MENGTRIVTPHAAFEHEFYAMVQESLALGEDVYPRNFRFFGIELHDIAGFVRRMHEVSRGQDLPEGIVPSSTYWLVDGAGRLLAESRLRHGLTPALEHEGGHIGYVVRPCCRRRGYGTRLLGLTLAQAGGLGLSRVLLTCNVENIGSAKIIERNGGVRENVVVSRWSGKDVARYWIDLDRKLD